MYQFCLTQNVPIFRGLQTYIGFYMEAKSNRFLDHYPVPYLMFYVYLLPLPGHCTPVSLIVFTTLVRCHCPLSSKTYQIHLTSQLWVSHDTLSSWSWTSGLIYKVIATKSAFLQLIQVLVT